MAKTVRPEQILGYLRRSDALNSKYTGPDWIDIGWGRFTAAAEQEFEEFLAEVTAKWKWYSSKPKLNHNAALFELVDWFLFTASALHCTHRINGLDGVDLEMEFVGQPGRPAVWGTLGDIDIEHVMVVKQDFIRITRENPMVYSIWYMAHALDTFLSFIGATPQDFDQAYQAKYAICLKRVEGGIMTGGAYRKDSEVYPEILK